MSVKTFSNARHRTQCKLFVGANANTVEQDYNAYETEIAALVTATFQMRMISFLWDGTNFVLAAEVSFPERTDNALGRLPEIDVVPAPLEG